MRMIMDFPRGDHPQAASQLHYELARFEVQVRETHHLPVLRRHRRLGIFRGAPGRSRSFKLVTKPS
jgi:hypothetical protein